MKADENKTKDGVLVTPSTDLEFRKTNEAIGLRVSQGRLSLLSRKIFNALVFHAQSLGQPGKNPPIDTEVAKSYFWIPMADIARNSDYDSKDTELLKSHLEELQNIKVVKEDERQWTSEHLVSSVKIVNPAGLKKKGGKLWIGFVFPPEVASLILNPGTYTKLSIYYITLLRSGPAVALYEICRRYATSPSHVTASEPWEWWYEVLSGNPIADGLPEYKYFKRDAIKGAIAEINAVTDINIELIEFKEGRKIVNLQFRVYVNEQQPLDFPAAPVIDGAIIEQMMTLGVNQKEATDLFVTQDESTLRSAIKMTQERMANKGAERLDHPSAYFKTLVRKGYAKGISVKAEAKSTEIVKKPSLREQFATQARIEAERYFTELDIDEQNLRLDQFIQVADKTVVSYLRKSKLKTRIAHIAFMEWLALELWGEPSEADLIKFAESQFYKTHK